MDFNSSGIMKGKGKGEGGGQDKKIKAEGQMSFSLYLCN
jgi:hypothetical protein